MHHVVVHHLIIVSHVIIHHLVIVHHVVVHHHVSVGFDNPQHRRDGRGVHGHIGNVVDAHGDCAHIAGRQSNSDDIAAAGIAEPVAEVAGEPYYAIARGTGVGGELARRLEHALPDGLVALCAQVPIIDLVADIAADGRAHIIEGDAIFIWRQEAIVGLGEHGGEGQGIAFVGVDDKFISAAGQGGSRGISADRHSRHAGIAECHHHAIIAAAIVAVSKDGTATQQQGE